MSHPDMSSNEYIKQQLSPTVVQFWAENPNVLIQFPYITELFPVDSMSYNQKLNAITRLVIIMFIIGFTMTRSFRLLVITAITMAAIWFMHNNQNDKGEKENARKENFLNPSKAFLSQYPEQKGTNVFQEPSPENPLSNVLMTDYDYNPNKKTAPPSFNENVNDGIIKQTKKSIAEMNPDQPAFTDKLFGDLAENLMFEQSMRQFYSNPGTTIPNDQDAFAEFCYGSMVSCKEGNPFACARNFSRYTNV